MSAQKVPTLKLNNGASIPQVGLGTWLSEPGEVEAAVLSAVRDHGYRHIDAASNYGNEAEIGAALKELFDSGVIKREDIFVTSKLNNPYHAEAQVRPACEKTLRDLGLKYVDLYLMHWPCAETIKQDDPEPKDAEGKSIVRVDYDISVAETWRAMEKLVDAGLCKAIGVCNFSGALLHDLMSYARIKPAMLQIENHPFLPQPQLLAYTKKRGIVLTAYSPLGTPGSVEKFKKKMPKLLEHPIIVAVAKKHNRSPAQICLRWQLQRGVVVIPKSVTPARIKENMSLFDFVLADEDMVALDDVSKPATVRYLEAFNWHGLPLFA